MGTRPHSVSQAWLIPWVPKQNLHFFPTHIAKMCTCPWQVVVCCVSLWFFTFSPILNFSFIEDVSNASQVAGSGKEPTRQCRRRKKCGLDPWVRKIPLEEEMAAHHSIRGWEVPWTEEPGGLQSRGSQRVGHDSSDLAHTVIKLVLLVPPSLWSRALFRPWEPLLCPYLFIDQRG